MKKSLMLISFAFIFLLTLSVVSAGLWITGDVQRGGTIAGGSEITKSIDNSNGVKSFSRTSSTPIKAGTSGTTKRTSQASKCPSGWGDPLPAMGGGYCCRKSENPGINRRDGGRFPWGYKVDK